MAEVGPEIICGVIPVEGFGFILVKGCPKSLMMTLD
jgi:hypothetical protein